MRERERERKRRKEMKKEKQHIGILTWYNHGNYGSALQSYALQVVLRRMGYDVEVIAYQMQWIRRSGSFIKKIKTICKKYISIYAEHIPFLKRYQNHFQYFYYKHISFSKVCDERNIATVCRKYDAIISGSDQIWSPACLDPIYLLNFCLSQSVRKIAYAPSLGINFIHENFRPLYKRCLSNYHALSVREYVGAQLLKELGFVAEVVLDPTMLLNKDDYIRMENPIKSLVGQKFVFCYFLQSEQNYQQVVKECANKYGVQIVGISANKQDYGWMYNVDFAGPCEFLWLIHHAKCVFTNSFHGTVLSMIFGKHFYTIERFSLSDSDNQDSRIIQLSQTFHISSMMENELFVLDSQTLDNNIFQETWNALKMKSIQYLSNALMKG